MKRKAILTALCQVHNMAYQEYRVLMALGTQLLNDGKHETFHEIERYANGKSCLLDGITLAASALGIGWEELTGSGDKEEAKK